MRQRLMRVILLSVLLLSARNVFAPLQPDCNNQPDLRCGLTCSQSGCTVVYTSDNSTDRNYCYEVGSGSTNCLGGTYHKCCL